MTVELFNIQYLNRERTISCIGASDLSAFQQGFLNISDCSSAPTKCLLALPFSCSELDLLDRYELIKQLAEQKIGYTIKSFSVKVITN